MKRIIRMIFALWPFYVVAVIIAVILMGLSYKPSSTQAYIPPSQSFNLNQDNALDEICKDWLFTRAEIIKKTRNGDTKGAAESRAAFNSFTKDMHRYSEKEIAASMERIKQSGYRYAQ